MRWWAFWRRVEYGAAFLVLCAGIGTGLYYMYGYEAPTCFDGLQNGDERNVDCGGVCQRICPMDITMPTALWAESFKVVNGQYNAVAYVENRNKDIGSPELSYTFKLFDAQGALITERSGTTVLPPDGVYPIFEGRIMTGDRVPAYTSIEFGEDILWRKGSVGRDQFTLEKRELVNADSLPKLTANLRNSSLDEAEDVEIVATIFDSQKHPLTAARTVLKYFPGRTSEDVVFTWPEPIAKTVKSCEIPTDVALAIDLSGSMDNDGGTPPEPISSVLAAATDFAKQLKEDDQVTLVTYATKAEVVEPLTHESSRVANDISKLAIDPKEQTGSTNTGDALLKIASELGSTRHSADARKVAILLTDGLATAPDDPEVYAIREAEDLKQMDVLLFTIGLGADVNEDFLRAIASNPSMYHKAPSAKDLSSIYAGIKKDICEDGPAVIEIIAKPKTSFQ
ncbi:MAG TPA: vWA domain-containing protein [Candidatus Paceibacterota bacterium]|nr:vWA domain-containing protein [Candidatus Paceibacterota bacterium]